MNRSTQHLSLAWHICLLVLAVAIIIAAPDFAYAGTNTPLGNVLCVVSAWFTGNVGKGLATIGVTIIGIGALLGKVSWGMAMIVGIGVAIVFGAAGMVNTIGAGVGGIVIAGSPNCT